MTLAWIYLIFAGIFEICWAIGLKYCAGFTKFWPSVFTLTTLAASMILLARAAQMLPIGTAYAVWVGIGAFGAALFGIILFNEPANLARIFFLLLLVIAILGLKFSAN